MGAQERIEVPARLTLEDAIAIARERSPELAQARNSLDAQGSQVSAGFGSLLPTLTAQLSFGGSDSRTVSGLDDFGQPVEQEIVRRFQSSTSSQGLYTGLTLFNGLRSLKTYSAAKASFTSAEENRLTVETRVDAETTRRFYDAIRTRQLIALEDRLLASAREQRDATSRLFRTASATQEDLLGAEADVASQELQLARAEGEAEKALLAVREQLALVEAISFAVTGEVPTAWDPASIDPDSLVAVAVRTHPDVARLDAAARAAHLRASAARGSYWPTVRLGASLSRSSNAVGYDALFNFNPQNRTLGFSLSLDWPLFQGFQTRAQVAQASADALNAEESLRAAKLAREREVRAALIDLQNAYRGVALAERATELSNERLRLSRERYAIGAITFANLQILIDRAAQEERQLINARYSFVAAAVTLNERVGQPVRP
ncbi:MAG: TolC family protein [Gemmatimonadota bacterium]|nr:TolC family protein [Gemmatimonadota bacterium]MDH4350250.1 TolC family protein [Gemmatimonadota bacterium]MDH5196238.1 TolC family protein [Gemmatimonadota bacterium]